MLIILSNNCSLYLMFSDAQLWVGCRYRGSKYPTLEQTFYISIVYVLKNVTKTD